MSSPIVTRRGAQKAKIQTRGMVRKVESRKPSAALLEAKKKAREKLNNSPKRSSGETITIRDIYQSMMDSIQTIRGATGIMYDDRMAEHRCLWDPNFPECPERYTRVVERCRELKLIDRCVQLSPREATVDEILTKHTQELYDLLKSTSQNEDEEQMEELCTKYDAIFIHPTTFQLSVLAVGSTIELIDNIVSNKVQNGMAIIRPPGHHALKSEYNGYCFFNNVAIAAQHALDNRGLNRILLVDWDIHHGQASQRMFYNDPRVLYFSIHRYDHGTFWPNLRESDFDWVGEGDGKGYNINVPLNKTGMTNADYLAIFQQILMPVAIEFQPELVIVSAGYDGTYGCPEFCPELVIVSAGYDSALGDEKGEMEVTPGCFPHLLSPLMSLANGKVAAVLEGGYCLQSLAEGAALTLKTLLGDPCPVLVEPLTEPCESIQETIYNCIQLHRPYWNSLQTNGTYSLEEYNNFTPQSNLHKVVQTYKWNQPTPERFLTRDCYPVQSQEFLDRVAERLTKLSIATNLFVPPNRVCYVYDEVMLLHKNLDEDHPEKPERLETIEQRFREFNLFERLQKLPVRSATTDELCLAHTRLHVSSMRKIVETKELQKNGEKYNSVYFHPKTFECACVAAGSVLQVVDDVLNGKSRSGVCVVRPPGHHAESDLPHGFCIFNNVAIAAQYAIRDHGLKRVLIVDWDVHHGNGTQHIFESSPNVLYMSIHRYDYGNFFPRSEDANYDVVGEGRGKGFNVNIPWNAKGMGDMEYMTAFQRVIMPIAYEFAPELVLVSAGFDAALGDPLGGCKVTPEGYGYFTHWLSALANGRVIVCLEGGYNVNSVSYAMTACTKALLGDPLPILQTNGKLISSCVETIQNVLSVQHKYWRSLKFNKKLPNFDMQRSPIDDLYKEFHKVSIKTANEDANDGDTGSGKQKESLPGSSRDLQPSTSTATSSDSKTATTLSEYLAENLNALQNEEMFAVFPLKNCPHLSSLQPDLIDSIDTRKNCTECESTNENWICLGCSKICCGRFVNEHMLYHHLDSDHPLTLSFADLSVWCYKCDSYIDNPCLFKYKNLAHQSKFGEEMVWSYGDTLELDVPSGSRLS